MVGDGSPATETKTADLMRCIRKLVRVPCSPVGDGINMQHDYRPYTLHFDFQNTL